VLQTGNKQTDKRYIVPNARPLTVSQKRCPNVSAIIANKDDTPLNVIGSFKKIGTICLSVACQFIFFIRDAHQSPFIICLLFWLKKHFVLILSIILDGCYLLDANGISERSSGFPFFFFVKPRKG